MNTVSFSLSLTLSRWEREQLLDALVKFASRGADSVFGFSVKKHRDFDKKPGAFLPLPEGEGRGEGEYNNQSLKSKILK
jgi:hypothetical protein